MGWWEKPVWRGSVLPHMKVRARPAKARAVVEEVQRQGDLMETAVGEEAE